jgi:hypothetical protein
MFEKIKALLKTKKPREEGWDIRYLCGATRLLTPGRSRLSIRAPACSFLPDRMLIETHGSERLLIHRLVIARTVPRLLFEAPPGGCPAAFFDLRYRPEPSRLLTVPAEEAARSGERFLLEIENTGDAPTDVSVVIEGAVRSTP